MCPTRWRSEVVPLQIDLTAAFSMEHGAGRADLLKLAPQLTAMREQILSMKDGPPPNMLWLPTRLLDEYKQHRRGSGLGQILGAAKRLSEAVDRVAVLGPPQLVAAAKVLFSAGCHPYHNELSRGDRGGRPRIYFAPAHPDNDGLQSLLDLLPWGRQLHGVHDRWGLVILDDGRQHVDGGLLTALAVLFCEAIQTTIDVEASAKFAIIAGPSGTALAALAERMQLQRLEFADAVTMIDDKSSAWTGGANASAAFYPAVLLAASVMGMDIVRLLRGAAAMNKRFAESPPGDNPPLDLAGLSHLLAERRKILGRIVDTPLASLQPLGRLLETDRSATGGSLIQLIPHSVRHDRLCVTMPTAPPAKGRKTARETPLLQLANDQAAERRQTRQDAGLPTAVIELPSVDEVSIGQLIQLVALVEMVESNFA